LAARSGRLVLNVGVPSDTTSDALAQLEAAVLSKNPGLAIVEFGANDAYKKVPLFQSKANLSGIISKIQQKGAMVVVVDPSGKNFLREYSDVFKEVSTQQ